MIYQKQTKEGFTLVELIVVITILAILGTIAILAFSGYSKNARDSARISDIGNMKKSLELWILQSGTYPEPTNGTGVTYSGGTVWIQGTFGDSVLNTVGKLDKKPIDPKYNAEYTYSIIASKKEFQIGAVLEKDMASNSLISQSYAASSLGEAYVSGTYNGILATVGINPTYILALPSIILSDTSNVELKGTTSALVYEGKSNLPSSYVNLGLTMTGTNFTFTPVEVWSGSTIANLNNQGEFQELVANLQTAYKTDTNFATLPEYTNIVGTEELSTMVMTFTKLLVETNTAQELTNVSITPSFSCTTNPGYINATYDGGEPTQINQVWQNTNSQNPCYYACTNSYSGNNCDISPIYSFTWSGGLNNTSLYTKTSSAKSHTVGSNYISADLGGGTDPYVMVESNQVAFSGSKSISKFRVKMNTLFLFDQNDCWGYYSDLGYTSASGSIYLSIQDSKNSWWSYLGGNCNNSSIIGTNRYDLNTCGAGTRFIFGVNDGVKTSNYVYTAPSSFGNGYFTLDASLDFVAKDVKMKFYNASDVLVQDLSFSNIPLPSTINGTSLSGFTNLKPYTHVHPSCNWNGTPQIQTMYPLLNELTVE